MRIFYLTLLLFFLSPLNVFANTGISFVYINGSNVKNKKINKWYIKGVKNIHPYIKTAFEKNSFTQKYFLKCGKYFIKNSPVLFFWGDKYPSYSFVNNNSFTLKRNSVWFSNKVRLIIKDILHDIIWVQDSRNMNFVLDKLHETLKAEIHKGSKIVLYGYSSGSFITYEYLLTRSPYIDIKEFFKDVYISQEKKNFVFQHPVKNTCISALSKDLAIFSADGHIIFNNNFDTFKKAYLNLNTITDSVCIPNHAIMGAVNIASPLGFFKPDMLDRNSKLLYYNRLLYKYLIENGKFWITVNYREDALSFSGGNNLTIGEFENLTDLNVEPHSGFIYYCSDIKGGILSITHMHYFSTKKTLSKAIVKVYEEGFRHEYENKLRQNLIKKYRHKLDIEP
jgi:hypothetical protein